tara:strand:+ start:63 stop:989 length:927 start_codon:yes stop_codon:yes gene_type:complete
MKIDGLLRTHSSNSFTTADKMISKALMHDTTTNFNIVKASDIKSWIRTVDPDATGDCIFFEMRECGGDFIKVDAEKIQVYRRIGFHQPGYVHVDYVDETNYDTVGKLVYTIEDYYGIYPVEIGCGNVDESGGACLTVALKSPPYNLRRYNYVKIWQGYVSPFTLSTHPDELECAYTVTSGGDSGDPIAIDNKHVYMFEHDWEGSGFNGLRRDSDSVQGPNVKVISVSRNGYLEYDYVNHHNIVPNFAVLCDYNMTKHFGHTHCAFGYHQLTIPEKGWEWAKPYKNYTMCYGPEGPPSHYSNGERVLAF